MQYIPVITLALVVVLLVLVIVLLTRRQQPSGGGDANSSITALGTLVNQNLREGREAQMSQLSAMDTRYL